MVLPWLAPRPEVRAPADPGTGRSRLRRAATAVGRHAARYVWLLLALETVAVAWAHRDHVGRSWHYFRTGSLLLMHPSAPGGGLHLYHANPQLQIGPLTFLVAWPFAALPPAVGQVLAVAAMCASGLLVLWLATGLLEGPADRRRRVLLLPGLLFVPVWAELAVRSGHLDDALAIVATVAALRTARSRPLTTAVLLAVAVGCKPWAVVFAPLILVSGRRRGRAAAVWLVVVVAPWLPFLIADPGTLVVTHFGIPNVADSALRFLGVHAATTPWWCRPAQVVLGGGVAWIAVRRGRPEQVLLAGIAARMLLDPETYAYYTAGLLAATAIVDMVRGRRIPSLSIGAIALVLVPAYVHVGPLAYPQVAGALRAAFCLGALALVVTARGTRREVPQVAAG